VLGRGKIPSSADYQDFLVHSARSNELCGAREGAKRTEQLRFAP
jgi:hypothetical protein